MTRNDTHSTPIPTRWIGPLTICGNAMNDTVRVPLATYESPLWPSTARGAKVAEHCGGVRCTIVDERMARSVLLTAADAASAFAALQSIHARRDELAAVIGHEMTHALREHSKAQVGQQLLTGIGMQIGSSILAQNSNVDPQTLQTGGALLSEYGISKPFSRQHETEADIGGLMLMAAAGYNPQAAPVVWQKMEQAGSSGMPSFLSTHPSGADRIQVLQQHMPEAMALYQQSGGRAPAPMPAAQANPLPQGIPVAQPAAVAPQPSNWVPQNPGVGMPVEQWMQKPGKRRR